MDILFFVRTHTRAYIHTYIHLYIPTNYIYAAKACLSLTFAQKIFFFFDEIRWLVASFVLFMGTPQ